MKRIITSGMVAVVLGVGVFCVSGTQAAEINKNTRYPQTEIVLTGKKEVRFGHDVHVNLGMACGVCHHDAKRTWLSEEQIAEIKDASKLACSSCHNETFRVETLRDRKATFHSRCKDCHQKGYKDKKGPVTCNGCHEKK